MPERRMPSISRLEQPVRLVESNGARLGVQGLGRLLPEAEPRWRPAAFHDLERLVGVADELAAVLFRAPGACAVYIRKFAGSRTHSPVT
jgi:hypothetical protein